MCCILILSRLNRTIHFNILIAVKLSIVNQSFPAGTS